MTNVDDKVYKHVGRSHTIDTKYPCEDLERDHHQGIEEEGTT